MISQISFSGMKVDEIKGKRVEIKSIFLILNNLIKEEKERQQVWLKEISILTYKNLHETILKSVNNW